LIENPHRFIRNQSLEVVNRKDDALFIGSQEGLREMGETKMTTSAMISSAKALSAALAILSTSGIATLAHADAPRFTFNAVEYMPRDQREAAAQAFVNQNITAGQPIAVALKTVEKAGAYCHGASADGSISCTHSSFERHPGQGFADVTWNVRIVTAADGSVAAATVDRSKAGN
jgi:hypothetical protein